MCKKVSRRKNSIYILIFLAVAIPVCIFISQNFSVPLEIYKYVVSYGLLVLWVLLLLPSIYFIYKKKKYIRFLVPYAIIWLILSSLIFTFFILNAYDVLDYIYFQSSLRVLSTITLCGVLAGFMIPVSYYIYLKKKDENED